jgi:stage V sporulation protein S
MEPVPVEPAPVEPAPHYAADSHPRSWIEDQPATPAGLGELEDTEAFVPANGVATAANGHVLDDQIATISGEILKVSARSRPSAVAGAIAGVVRESGKAEVQAIGAGATNQAVKAVAIARDYLRETGIEAVCLPAFIDVTIENEDRTAIRLVVEPR